MRRRRSSLPMAMPGSFVDDEDHDHSTSATDRFHASRTSLPYPSFSKAHSREAVGKVTIPTPDPTEPEGKEAGTNGAAETKHASGTESATGTTSHGDGRDQADNHNHGHKSPPSPPLTNDQQSSRKGSMNGDSKDERSTSAEEREKPRNHVKTKVRIRTKSSRSSSLREKRDDEPVKMSRNPTDASPKKPETKDVPSRSPSTKPIMSTFLDQLRMPKWSAGHADTSPATSNVTIRDAANSSGATPVSPNQPHNSQQRPMSPPLNPPSRNQSRSSMSSSAVYSPASNSAYDYGRAPKTNGVGYGVPPPPPPPPEMPVAIPRVDYLLRLGGLEDQVPRALLAAVDQHNPSYAAVQPQLSATRVFEPFHRLLDDYQKVMTKSGSLAVATGYRSVARRLLDRLEAVFARDISSEYCECPMCDRDGVEEHPSGVSWGEILEMVAGRKELPTWPPFTIEPSVIESELSGEEHIPMQKLDIDVPEEYREHYIRQSRKTKIAVDKWLSEQTTQATSSPPDEVDDETLTFAMLTRLNPDQRLIFCMLLGVRPSTPVPQSDSSRQPRARPPSLISSSLAIERLYRLPSPPRDPETAIFMLNNPDIHHILATISAISDDEWDILVSGRFDGFLRSGAEDDLPPLGSTPSRWGSRSGTPFSAGGISRGTTPNQFDPTTRSWSQPSLAGSSSSRASFGGPIALDEETEIAALAEIERDIFLGMEALEDAFEALHGKAELVRRALRERGAGLAIANQSRRGTYIEARMGTPASALGSVWEDDGLDDSQSLYPDDSASNISSNRRRRPRRRSERRTPALVEEDEEEGEQPAHTGNIRRGHGSRRR